MIAIQLNKKFENNLSISLLEEITQKIFSYLDIEPQSDLSILIDTDAVLKKLNKQYREINQPTDVLSFESDEINPETGFSTLGDIAISYPTAQKQALEANHPVENEVILLLIHAILHLSGYDHSTKEEKEEMWSEQQAVLDHIGIKINRIAGDEEFHD
ncbi:MAG: rRNA maturation RNase YbeY [Chloroflexi bacterium HGW-Chloroflexi-5]|jgi:probable rRNA maturation factor|nr:MAG: rRNA maturation RNase YbeY [Chloroflexi bacterium HGW-Chloroflexi-5]